MMEPQGANSPGRNTRRLDGGLPAFAVRRPVTMLMLFLSLLVIGAVALYKIPLQLFPEGFNPPFLYVWLFYPNASPEDNQERIATPVEDALWTVKGVKRIRSRITERGCGQLIEFQPTADMDVAYQGIRDRLERVRPDLPEDLRYVYIWRYSESDEPVLYFGISIKPTADDDPYRLVEDEVVKRLERVDGVARVEMWGGEAKQVRIEFLLERLKAHNINLPQLMQQLSGADFAIAGGTVTDPDREVLVRVNGRLRDLDEIRNLPVQGNTLLLGDIANVVYAEPVKGWVERIGRQEAIEVAVYKTSDANTVELSNRLKEVLDGIRRNPSLAMMTTDVLFDQGKYIRESLNNLKDAGYWGALFAVMVLFFFLRRVRMTFFIMLAIPLSLLATIVCLYFMGWSLNIITLSGLMLSVGMVVDNAIVVVESIQTSREEGHDAKRAAVIGTNEVALAITLATLTTVVVFLPLMLMSGDRMLSFFMLRVGMPVIFALLFSLLAALLLIPLLVHRLALPGVAKESPLIARATDLIERNVRWALKHRGDATLISLLVLGTIALPMKMVISTDQEEGNINDLHFEFRFPSYYTLANADSTMAKMESLIYERAEDYDVKTVITGFRRGSGRMQVFMNDKPDHWWLMQGLSRAIRKLGWHKNRAMTREEVIADLKERFKAPPDVDMHTSWSRGGEQEAVYISIYGEDIDKLMGISEEVQNRLRRLPGAVSVSADLERGSDEVVLHFNRGDAARRGVDAAQAAAGVTSLIRGVDLAEITFQGHETQLRAELQESDRATLSQVVNLPVGGWRGEAVRLGDVADIGYRRGVSEITTENRRTQIQLKISTTEANLKRLSRDIDANLADLSLPPGYDWSKGARFEELQRSEGERNNAWILAITFVLLLMGALFESFLLPWVVIITVPFSFFGVWWLLFATGTQFGIMAAIGVIILIGVIVNNAIVLVDRANRLRERGMPRDEALALASRQRLRPIAMTALTTIMGLVPMAIGDANLIGLPYSPMGRAMIGGMVTGTLTTPLMVSLFYSYLDDFSVWWRRQIGLYRQQ